MFQRLLSYWSVVSWAALAALLYCSWPLGYVLNPLVAEHGLASELAGARQPYNWLFVWGDVVSGVILLFVALMLRNLYKQRLDTAHYLSLAALGVFGTAIVIAAISQVPCISALHSCPNFTHNSITLIHGISSVGSCVSLWLSVAVLWWYRPRDLRLALFVSLFALFGGVAFISLISTTKAIVIQNGFITFCSLCLLVYPWFFEQSFKDAR